MKRSVNIWILAATAMAIATTGALADDGEEKQTWGIGLQGNAPLWGGLSIKYMGFENVHLQVVEHYLQDGDGDYSFMFGFQMPIIVARQAGMTIFLAPAVGMLREQNAFESIYYEDQPTDRSKPADATGAAATVRHTQSDISQGGALFIGTEIFLDRLFGLKSRSRYGLSFQFGQAIGRIKHETSEEVTTVDGDGNPGNLEKYPDLKQRVDNDRRGSRPGEDDNTGTKASLAVAVAFHINF